MESSSESEEEATAEDQVCDAMRMGEHLHMDKLKKSEQIAEAFDTAFEYIDALHLDDNWDDSTKLQKVKGDLRFSSRQLFFIC